ncbi:MAG: hypothetical protein AB1440_26480 [Pseudomonadota bacterium]
MTETDGQVRSTLRSLLVAEEDKFARLSERLDVVDQNLLRVADRTTQQRSILDGLPGDGDGAALARRYLENLEQLHELFAATRRRMITEMDRRSF